MAMSITKWIATLLLLESTTSFQSPLLQSKQTLRIHDILYTPRSKLHSSVPNEDDILKNWQDDDDDELEELNLGINIGKELGLSESELLKAGKELMTKAYEKELADMEKQRARMKRDTEREAGVRQMASDLRAKFEAEKLLERIDKRRDRFLSETKEVRESTKMAAKADGGMEGKGVELGSWGRDGSGNVVTTGYRQWSPLSSLEEEWGEVVSVKMENKVLLIKDDNKASQTILNELSTKLQDLNIKTEVISPIGPAPLGGLDSQTVVFFASSFTEKSAVMTMMDRILSRTASPDGRLSIPPSHIVCISALGTVKASSSGLLGFIMTGINGKLDKYREIEEGIISKCRTRFGNHAFDYSILKLGNIKDNKAPIAISYGDAGSGDIDASTASQVLLQTIAYQYHSRNTTFSATGSSSSTTQQQWDDLFTSLDGPELLRTYIPFQSHTLQQKCQFYIQNWARTKFVDAKTTGLSTPVLLQNTDHGVKIVFKQTNTGKAYTSKEEERKLEQNKYTDTTKKQLSTKELMEGGIEILFETDYKGQFRTRAKRCNMNYDTVVKEMSEETILSQFKTAIDYFIQNNKE